MPPAAALPANESERLARLRELEVLDTLPEKVYDDITALAQAICGTQIALITLVDEHRQWFKSRLGIAAAETPREVAFCAHAILRPQEVMVVEDARNDMRFRGNPLVVPEGPVRFYAGAPIVTDDGLALGTVCVIDGESRRIEPLQVDALRRLSDLVATLLLHEKERRQAQEQHALDTERRIERLTAMATAGLDLQAYIDNDSIYRHVNQTYLDYNACGTEDVIGRHVSEHVGEALYRDVVGFQLTRALRGEPVFYQRRVQYQGRGTRHMEVALLPVRDADGAVQGVVMRAHDIEVLKQNEARLNRTVDLLERKTREQQRFIRMLSHDLREPVNGINNFCSLLVEDHLHALPADAQRYLGFVREGGQRAGRLIDNLVAFAQLDAYETSPEAVDIAQVMRQVKESLEPMLRHTHGRIETGPLPVVTGDARLLHQALHNLVANALAFARRDVPPVVKVVASQDATVDQIHVCDNGIGIAEEHQSAIFDVFSRLNNRRHHDGTGLGLAICQRIADLHQGRLSVESQPGEGSRFTLHLPVVGERN